MAHSTNRTIDFAPAWLKLPENNQEAKKQEASHNPSYHHTHTPSHTPSHTLSHTPSYRHSISHADHYAHQPPHHPVNDSSHSHYSLSQRNSGTSHNHHQYNRTGGRPHQINTYRSGSSSSTHHPVQLQRSQSTGSYNDSAAVRQLRPATVNASPVATVTKPLEEEFPLLCSGPVTAPPGLTQSQFTNQVNSTAQWRVKERTREDSNGKNASSNQPNDKLLTGNMSGKVYRAQVKPVKRTNMIPISMSNGGSSIGSVISNVVSDVDADEDNGGTTIKPRVNGQCDDHTSLSSSLDKEKKFLQELGWNEDEESDDDCVIPEQDPAKLQQIMMEAKAARQRLLMKSKQSMKSVPSAALPNEDDLPSSSSDNSDNE